MAHRLRAMPVHSLLCKSMNGQSMDYENCRFVCTSMKRGLAMLKVWSMKIVCLLLVSVRYSVSSSNTLWQLPGMKYAKSEIYTHFLKFERASIRSVNIMVLCICWMLCLFTKVDATLWNACWHCFKYGLSTCYVFFYIFIRFFVGFVMPGCMNHAVARGLIQNFHSYRRHFRAEWALAREMIMRCWEFYHVYIFHRPM